MSVIQSQIYKFMRIADNQTDYILYLYENTSPKIFIKQFSQNKLLRSKQIEQQQQKHLQLFNRLFEIQFLIQNIEIKDNLLIFQINFNDNIQSLIIDIQQIDKIQNDYKQIQNLYLIYRQNFYLEQRQKFISQINNLKLLLSSTLYNQSILSQKQNILSSIDKQQIQIFKIKYKLLQQQFQSLKNNYKQINKINKQLQLQIKNISLKIDYKYLQQNQQEQNQYTDYIQASQPKKIQINSNGFNQFIFQPFTIGKYINSFIINHKNIKFKQKIPNYYQLTSFHGIPITGKTKIGFKIIHSKNNNILIGILLSIRKRLRYSYQQSHLISYKIKGGKYGLYIDGYPMQVDCQQVTKGQCLWMIINRQQNTIEFKNNKSNIFKMPTRFQTAPLFPFITMKDKGDQIQII